MRDAKTTAIMARKLTEVLQESSNISRYDRDGASEADAIAQALVDIPSALEKIVTELVPKLLEPDLTAAKIDDVVWEIRDELRQVVWHLRDCKTFEVILQ